MSRHVTVLPVLLLFGLDVFAQQNPPLSNFNPAIPAEAAHQQNPVKPTPPSLARAKKWWGMDCAMCHDGNGDGRGDTARDMKLQMSDFTDPATLKSRTDGELFYIIKKGYQDMPGEGDRLNVEENWDLVNYVRSFAKSKSDEHKTAESKGEAGHKAQP